MTDKLRYETLAQAAKAAIDVQDACNASGVALAMFEATRTVRADLTANGRSPNRHPIMQLFAYKLAALCIHEPLDEATQTLYTAAVDACGTIIATDTTKETL